MLRVTPDVAAYLRETKLAQPTSNSNALTAHPMLNDAWGYGKTRDGKGEATTTTISIAHTTALYDIRFAMWTTCGFAVNAI
jgi:hypothetical protein